MSGLFQKKFWPPNYESPPWGDAPAIYDHIVSHIDPSKETGLADGGDELPDEPERDPDKLKFGVGAMDGMMSHHGQPKPESELVKDFYARLHEAIENASEQNIEALYSFAKESDLLYLIDAFIEEIQRRRDLDADRLRDLSLWFATKGADRNSVKFAIAMLGLLRGYDDLEVFLTLGRHDEFTLYSVVAISSNEAYGERALFRLAKSVDGWGRIHAVERLANTNDPEIQDWLIRDGFKCDIMYEYLACICARAGCLEKLLEPEIIDDDLFASACDLVEALISGEGGPAEGLADYEHGCSVIRSILRHGRARFATASHYWFLSMLKQRVDDYLSDDHPIEHDWSKDKGRKIAAELASLLSGEQWKTAISEALENGDRQAFWDASRVSQNVGIDPWPYFYQRTENGENYWWDLMRLTQASQIDRVLELADKRIPVAEIATGAGHATGLGADFASHGALDFILQGLKKFPGKGWRFIEAGLQSPVIRNRNIAIRALSAWGRDEWPDGASDLVTSLIELEPVDKVRARFVALLEEESDEKD